MNPGGLEGCLLLLLDERDKLLLTRTQMGFGPPLCECLQWCRDGKYGSGYPVGHQKGFGGGFVWTSVSEDGGRDGDLTFVGTRATLPEGPAVGNGGGRRFGRRRLAKNDSTGTGRDRSEQVCV